VAEVLDEMGLLNRTIGVASVGCSVFAYNYFDVDFVQAPHGRAPAVGTGVARSNPQGYVISYQGDGDLAGIGGNEIVQAANRGENVTVVFVNNGVYGMTGGQMAPTTLLDQVTTTTPRGRDAGLAGHPVRICEVFAQLDGTAYLERVAVNKPAAVVKTKKAIRKAFQCQLDGRGFSLVEILSPCPVNWKMGTVEACTWIDEVMAEHFPLGVFKEVPC
jgi:2-oxoglutarate ferredoxin oxidoreductase subunit beta